VGKSLLLRLLEFIAITGPLTWWWMHGGQEAYWDFFIWVARDILAMMGVTGFPPSAVRERFMNIVPFVGLILATPRLVLTERLWGLFLGCLLIFWGQIVLAWWAFICFGSDGMTPEARMRFFPGEMLSDALPLIVWAVFANRFLSELLANVVGPAGQIAAQQKETKPGVSDAPPPTAPPPSEG
jgi:hypothetical protein